MINYKELREIDHKLGILIWMNLIIISAILVIAVFVIVYEIYWVFGVIIPVFIVHISVSYWLHVKLRKHTRPQ